jgi:hypothetical protein
MSSTIVQDAAPVEEIFEPAHDDPPPRITGHDDDGDGDRWLTVASFWEPAEAHIARLKLESEEIDCMMLDENLIATYWGCASALGGVKLQVRESDLSRAQELLHRGQRIEESTKPIYGQHCPHCGAKTIGLQTFSSRLAFVAILALAEVIPFIHLHQTCSSCGFRWKQ